MEWPPKSGRQREFPEISYVVGAAGFAILITGLNLAGIRWTAYANQLLLVFMCGVIGIFLLLAVRYLLHVQGWGGLLSTQTFYNPGTFDFHVVATATSFAEMRWSTRSAWRRVALVKMSFRPGSAAIAQPKLSRMFRL
jgi:hypothetical protein